MNAGRTYYTTQRERFDSDNKDHLETRKQMGLYVFLLS